MALETATYISDLNVNNPVDATDTVATLGDHARLTKSALKNTFQNITGAVTVTHTQLNTIPDLAPKASPALTGTPTAPTAAAGTNTTQIATTAFTNAAITAAALSSTVPTVAGDVGKVLTSDGANSGWSSSLKASVMRFADGTDATKLLAFSLSGLTTGTTRTVTLPDKSGTLAMTTDIHPTLGTPVATTSGTAIDFTGIPAGTKQIVINLKGVSTNGTSHLRYQLGTSGGVEATGYVSTGIRLEDGVVITANSQTAGFAEKAGAAAGNVRNGSVVFTLESASTNTWCAAGEYSYNSLGATLINGSKALSGELDRVRITTENGTDAFDAGEINITYI